MSSKTIVGAVLIAGPLSVLTASAQTWPAKPVRVIVPFAPGGSTDLQARLLSTRNFRILSSSTVTPRPGVTGTCT